MDGMAERSSESPAAGVAPGPSMRSLVGLMPRALQADPVDLAVVLRERHGHVVRIPPVYPGLEQPVYLVTHPDDVRYVLQTHPTAFRGLDIPSAADFGRVVSNSIVSLTEDSEGGSWMARLRRLSPEFREAAAADHVPGLARETLSTVAGFDETSLAGTRAPRSGGPASGDPGWRRSILGPGHDPARVRAGPPGAVRLLPAMRRLSLRLLGVSLFGPDVRVHETAVIRAVSSLRRQFKRRHTDLLAALLTKHLPDEVPLPSFLPGHEAALRMGGRPERSVEALRDVADAMVARREQVPNAWDDAASTWLTRPDPVTGSVLDGETMRSEMVGLLIAGFATLSAALTWAVYLAATHPGTGDRIRDEARRTQLFASLEDARAADHSSAIDGREVLDDLEYTRRVWQETLRLYPTLPLFGRTAREPVSFRGYEVEAGSPVLVSPYVTHRDPAFWDDPETFDPDRFAPERARDRPEFAYYPFSAGPHACLGRALATTEAVTALAAIFVSHRVALVDEDRTGSGVDGAAEDEEADGGSARRPTRAVGVDSGINLQPDREIVVRFVPR